MTVSVVPRKQTIGDAPFTFLIERVGKTFDESSDVYAISCLVDGYGICAGGFYTHPGDYQENLQKALADTKVKALAKVTDMRAEIARMQAIVDKVTGSV
jgi:hypothetical protein